MGSKAPNTKLLLVGETLVGLGQDCTSGWLLRIFTTWEEFGQAVWEREGLELPPVDPVEH